MGGKEDVLGEVYKGLDLVGIRERKGIVGHADAVDSGISTVGTLEDVHDGWRSMFHSIGADEIGSW